MIEFVEEFEGRFRKQYEACGEVWLSERLQKIEGDQGWVMYNETRVHERFVGFIDGKKSLAHPPQQAYPQPIETAPKDEPVIGYDPAFAARYSASPWFPVFWSETLYHKDELGPCWLRDDDTQDTVHPTHWLPIPPPPGESTPQVCPNCEEMRRQVATLAAALEFYADADNTDVDGGYVVRITDESGNAYYDDDEGKTALAALSTLKKTEGQDA